MKNIISLTTMVFLSLFLFSNAQSTDVVLLKKLENPEQVKKQTLKKRAYIWIDGQWHFQDNKHVWVSGHWVAKKPGYVFVNGEWMRKNNGWVWVEGYWKKIDMKKWLVQYS